MFTHNSRIAFALSAISAVCGWIESVSADAVCCAPAPPLMYVEPVVYMKPASNSWVFARSTFTHDPMTGARVAQYDRKQPVEPLDDQRAVTSVYRRTRSVNRGFDGSMDTSYQVQSWGNGRGGLDAEWQMFHDVWKESILSGGFFNQNGGWNNGWNNNGWNNGWNNGGNNNWSGGPGWNNGWNGWNGNWNNGWGNQGPGWGGGGPGGGNSPGWGGGFPNGPGGPGGPNGPGGFGGPNGPGPQGPPGNWNNGQGPQVGNGGPGNGPGNHQGN